MWPVSKTQASNPYRGSFAIIQVTGEGSEDMVESGNGCDPQAAPTQCEWLVWEGKAGER